MWGRGHASRRPMCPALFVRPCDSWCVPALYIHVSTTRPSLAQRLYDRYGPALRRYLSFATRHHTEADDLTQEVFLRIVRAASNFQPQEQDRAWVFRIARNVVLDDVRRRRRAPEHVGARDVGMAPAQGTAAALHHALDRLLHDEREAFLLAEVGGLTYAEIAAMTESTVPAVRSRIYRARLSLRDQLAPPAPLQGAAVHMREHDD